MKTVLNKEGGKIIDQEDNRRRLSAYELNGCMAARAAWWLMDMALPDLEKQARHVGVWGRLRAVHSQMKNMQHAMMDKISLEQLISLKNNTNHVKISIIPELVDEPEQTILPLKEHERLLCAALSYCEMHCDGSQCSQRGCKIKKLMDNNCYMQGCDFPQLVPGQCRYYMADVDWEPIRKG